MLTHENTDISLAAVSLLSEMIDSEMIIDIPEAYTFIDMLLSLQGLELLVQNITRLSAGGSTSAAVTHATSAGAVTHATSATSTSVSPSEEDLLGIHNTLSIIENLIELDTSVSITICEKTNILVYLLSQIKKRSFDSIKLYSSEILSIILQKSTAAGRRCVNDAYI